MKKLLLVLAVLLLGTTVFAQDTPDVPLEPYESSTMYVQGLKPEGWPMATVGGYARNPAGGDITLLVMQSAPLAREALEATLLQQFNFDELPERQTVIEGEGFTWDVYRFDIDVRGTPVALSMALSEGEGRSFVTLLQSAPEDHDGLRIAVFEPVVNALRYFDPNAAVAEEDTPYTSEDVTFSSGDLTLAGTITIPQGTGPFPAVVLVSGSGAQDRDSSLAPIAELKPFADLADALTRGGVAVLRYDERGVGFSEGDIVSASLDDFRSDALAAVAYLNERDEIGLVGVIGHSEGGLYLPQMVLEENVDFGVAIAPPVATMTEILREQNRVAQESAGRSPETVEAVLTAFDEAIAVLRDESTTEEQLREAVTNLIRAQLQGQEPPENLVNSGIAQFTSPLFAAYLAYDPVLFWSQVDDPVLVIFGELDTQVFPEQNRPLLEAATGDTVTIQTIEDMNHVMQAAESGLVGEYGQLEQTIMPDVPQAILDWMSTNVTD